MADSKREAQLTLSIKEVGAKEVEAELKKIGTTTTTLQQELGKLSRADQLQKLGADMGVLAKKTGDVSGAVADLSKQLTSLGATKDEIQAVAQAFNEAQSGGGGGNGPGGNLLQRAGSGLRSLPSIQIPGTGIGTDAIANITRLTGALGEAAGATSLMESVTASLTPVLGATAAGFAGVAAVAGPLILIVGALGLAIKSFSDSTSQQVANINSFADAQRALSDKIANGLTSDDAQKEADEIKERRDREVQTLAKLQAAYDESERQARETAEAQKPLIQGLFGARAGTEILANVAKAASADEQALADQIQKSKDLIAGYEANTKTLTDAQNDGTLAANDAAEAEKKLVEERTKATLTAADTAGKELAAQQKALNATEEQNTKRLEAIDDEKAVIQAQIDVLTESGDTSEEVTAKLAALNGQLGSLGKESEFIKNTALEVSRANDAEKKAKKDAEDAAKKAEQAQLQYTKSIENAGKQFTQSTQDIGTRYRQVAADNATKFGRDTVDIATKYHRDEFDLALKFNRAERDAALDQQDDLLKIRENGSKEEQDALREGDFKALFLARQKEAETLKQEQATIDTSQRKRQQDYRDARDDALRAAERQRSDRVLAYDRQLTDARIAQTRDLAQANLTRQRALQAASEGLNAELALRGQYWKAVVGQTQQALNQISGMAVGGTTTRSAPQAFSFKAMRGVISR
jgi:hypothetical protein